MSAVSARARQLSYRLKNRRTAIMSRRKNDASLQSQSQSQSQPQPRVPAETWRDSNGHNSTNGKPHVSPSGFVAVNTTRHEAEPAEDHPSPSQFIFSHGTTDNVTIINGTSIKGASPTTRTELMKKFFTTADRQARGFDDASTPVNSQTPRPQAQSDPADYSLYNNASTTPVAIPSTPSSLLPPPKTTPQEKDDGGPYKLEMVARMEELQRGERVSPPCDRCRRLHMDCLKNLTACVGCTKKHAKCSWRDVQEGEIRAANWTLTTPREPREPHEEIEEGRLSSMPPHGLTSPPKYPVSAEREHERHTESPASQSYSHSRRESAPGAPHIGPGSGASMGLPPSDKSPRRAVSETENSGRTQQQANNSRHADDEDPDANQRLMQAILDTVDHHARVAAAVQEKERGAGTERGGEPVSERIERVERVERTAERPAENPSFTRHDRDADRSREHDRDRDRERERERERWMLQT